VFERDFQFCNISVIAGIKLPTVTTKQPAFLRHSPGSLPTARSIQQFYKKMKCRDVFKFVLILSVPCILHQKYTGYYTN